MLRRGFAVILFLASLAALGLAVQTASVQAAPPAQAEVVGDPAKGEYLFNLNGGCGCHMGAAGFLAGGEAFEGPFGKVYPPNITSDPETGIGAWTEQDIVNVFHTGKRPDGTLLFPIMPYPSFSAMSNQDLHDLAAFVKTVPPVKNQVPERELAIPIPPFEPRPQPETAPTSGVARGEYVVNTISHCGDCHTPQGPQGPDFSRFLGGNQVDPDNYAPNITPHVEAGIGSWSQEQIATELKTGMRPSGVPVGGLMALVIEGGFKNMTWDDAFGIAAYLKSIPALPAAPAQAPAEGAAAQTLPAEAPAEGAAAQTLPAEAPAAGAQPQTLPATGGDMNNLPLVLALVAGGLVLLGASAFVLRSARRKN